MATINEAFAALRAQGFEPAGTNFLGTWNNYAILIRPGTGKNLLATVAVRLTTALFDGRKELFSALKEKSGNTVKAAGITKSSISFSIGVGKADSVSSYLVNTLNLLTEELRAVGVNPADTCAMTGAARPDSLCLMTKDNVPAFQPVCGAVLRENDLKTHEKAEENQENGSYATGFVGALLGMLVGVALNVAAILLTDRIYAVLFAVVPLAAMFGYKLFKGKMSKGSIGIVIVLSLVAVMLIPFFELVYYFVHDYGMALGRALSYAAEAMTDADVLSEISGTLLQLLLFMALGILIAWKYMSGSVNSNQVSGSEAQMATLRPNPAYAQPEDETQY